MIFKGRRGGGGGLVTLRMDEEITANTSTMMAPFSACSASVD